MSEKEDVLNIQTPDPTNLLYTRLENWKHAVSMLQDYLDAQVQQQKGITHGLEKTRKAVYDAPKFDFSAKNENGESQSTGVAESFEAIRTRTDTLANKSAEVEQSLKGSVGPELEAVKAEIQKHMKSMKGSNVKGQKDVDKAKQQTQKCVEQLGHYTSSSGTGAKIEPKNDPYILHRVAKNSVEDQLMKENTQMDSVKSTQNNFQTLEQHITKVMHQATKVISDIQTDWAKTNMEAHEGVANTFAAIPRNHEWELFAANNKTALVPGDAPKRDLSAVTFANDEHPSCKPVQEGLMQRKGKVSKSYNSNYYVLTQSNWLHAFKSGDHVSDPTPEWSMYIPEAQLGAADDQKAKFTLNGKSKSSGPSLGQKHTYQFKCATHEDMSAWYSALKARSGSNYVGNDGGSSSSRPTSAAVDSDVPPTSPTSANEAPPATGTTNDTAQGAAAATASTAATGGAAAETAPAATSTETPAAAMSSSPATELPVAQATEAPVETPSGRKPSGEVGVAHDAVDQVKEGVENLQTK